MSEAFFICGATGTQGGATARQLLQSGATVHALARDPTSTNAQALKDLGVKLWHGDFDNEDALKSALAGTSAVFLNFMPEMADLDANLRQAKLILRLAHETGTVSHVVYSSSVGTNSMLQSPIVEAGSMFAQILQSKVDIEQAVRESTLGHWTILRPGNFMANYVNPLASMQLMGLAETGRWNTANREADLMPLVDTTTIGRFSAAALLDPTKFHKREIAYADELISMGGIMQKLSDATGRDLRMATLTDEEIEAQRAGNPFIGGQLLMRDMHKYVDLEEAKEWGIPLSNFDEFLKRERNTVEMTYRAAAK
ncbi:hypothetical protein NQ176_g4297 [Zarea fungicola]|uniref:Uncharacterized protein n=1 Tax=Zarea fungicola TaxID=93591 RepID=A0ACC1NE18_9HYPO|nr:hypothetical protein NQ176_g4297 [Lecanicillium fungicola]